LAGLASTQAFAPGPAIGGLGHRSAGLALARQAPRPALRTAGGLRMESKVTAQEVDGQVEFMGVDAAGNMVKLNLGAKEKLYLDATSAFFNDNEKIMDDEDYDQLKNDLAFEGSNVGLMNRDEIKFMVAASRYAEGKPIMSDDEFDRLRRQLKQANSKAVIHEMPVCKIDSQTCKADLEKDSVKNFVLSLPALIVSTIIVSEFGFYLQKDMGLSPVVSLLVNSPFIAGATYLVTNFILFQQPLVTVSKCPRCQTEQPIFFGDVLFVDGGNAGDEVESMCVNKACQAKLRAYKSRMVVETEYGQAPPPPPRAV